MKKLFISVLILLSGIIFSQIPTFHWAKHLGGTGWDENFSVIADSLGSLYVTGMFQNTSDFNPTGVSYTASSAGMTDVFVTKYDQLGNYLWTKTFGGIGWEIAYSIIFDKSGNLLITGYFNSSVDFDPGPGVNVLTSVNQNDAFICKLTSSGNFIWAKQFGGNGGDVAYKSVIDGSGNIYTTGYFYNTCDFDPGPGTFSLSSPGNQDTFVAKLDSSGSFIWAKNFGGIISTDGPKFIALDPNANIYITGGFNNIADFDPGPSTFTLNSYGSDDIYVVKLDSSGNFGWAKQLGGSGADVGYSIAVDPTSNIYTCGFYSSASDFDPGPGAYTLNNLGGTDIFISKLDPFGNFIWAKQFAGSSGENCISLTLDAANNVYTTGHFSNTVDFDPGPSTYTLFSATQAAFISKLDATGNFVWVQPIGENAWGNSINISPLGNICVAGISANPTDFDPGPATYTLSSLGSLDGFTLKMGASSTNINSLFFSGNLQTYPNPTEGQFNLVFDKQKEKTEIKIFNSIGQIILQKNILSTDKISLSISDQPSGIYFVEVNADGESYRTKVVKE